MTYQQASKIAVDTCYKLQPYCKKLNIAGSVRRKVQIPGDIEIVCVAKERSVYDLFGNKTGAIKLASFIHTASRLGLIEKGSPMGKYMRLKVEDGIFVDLFMPSEEDYYRQYAIRTGSASYAHKVIANAWTKLGWCGSDVGLRRMSDCIGTKTSDGKTIWKCINQNGLKPPVWKSEEEFFNWLKLEYQKPELRNI